MSRKKGPRSVGLGRAGPSVLTREGVVVLPFIIAANLLATSSAPEEGEWWFNYLDKVEAAIEAAG